MKLALLSDIHGNLPALQAVLAEAAQDGIRQVVNLGDILSGPLWPVETARLLMPLGWPTLAGNHERQLLHHPPGRQGASDAHAAAQLDAAADGAALRAWLAGLPPTLAGPDGVFFCHGTPGSDLQYLLETVVPGWQRGGASGLRAATPDELGPRLAGLPQGVAVLACGHSHVPRCVQHDALLLVNPGSVGLQAYDDAHPHPHVAENGSPHARWAVLQRSASGWHLQQRATPYDWQAAAQQALRNGRPDWADALATGRVGRMERDLAAP